MAAKKTTATAAKKPATTLKRANRTADERISDLQQEIERIRARDAVRQVRASDDGRALIAAAKATSKALAAARDAGSESTVQALETAHAALAAELDRVGVRVRAPKARARKAESTAA